MEVNGVPNNITLDLADFQCIDKQNKEKHWDIQNRTLNFGEYNRLIEDAASDWFS